MNSTSFKNIAAGIMYVTCAIGITIGAINGTRETNNTVRNGSKANSKAGK